MLLNLRVSTYLIYFHLLYKRSSCIGSIDLIFGEICLPNNFDLTIFVGNNNRSVKDDNWKYILGELQPNKIISLSNISVFQTLDYQILIESHVQSLYIFLHENLQSFHDTLQQLNISYSSDKNLQKWNPIFILILPKSCEKSIKQPLSTGNSIALQKLVGSPLSFSLKEDIYILDFPCGENLTASQIQIWEFYSISNISFHHKFHFKINQVDNAWHLLGNKISRRLNFHGVKISATASNERNYQGESKFAENSASKFEGGTSVQRYWFLRDGLNFSEFAIQDEWTSENENGSLTGGAIKVANGEIDISIVQSAMTHYKKKYIDFLQPTDESILKAFFIQPSASKFRDIFINPFQPTLWMAMFCTWFLILLTMRLFAYVQTRINYINCDDKEIVKDSWIWGIATACQQGWYIQPVSSSIRMTFALGHLCSLVLFASYSASIVSYLSLKTQPMKTFSDILDNSFRIFANDKTAPIAYILPELRKQKNFPAGVLIPESTSIPFIMNSRSTVVTYGDVFYIEAGLLNYTEQELCEKIGSVRINRVVLRSAMIIRKGSPLKEIFNYQIMIMLEGGLNYRYIRMYKQGTETNCLRISPGHKQALGVNDIWTALVILLVGYLVSFVIFVCEVLFAYRKRFMQPVLI